MNRSSIQRKLQAILCALVLLSTTASFASDPAPAPRHGSLQLDYPATVAGTQLQAGKYRVEWTGTGDQVQVTFYLGNKAVVSTSAQAQANTGNHDLVSYTAGENGSKSLTQVFFSKQKVTLTLGESNAGEESAKK